MASYAGISLSNKNATTNIHTANMDVAISALCVLLPVERISLP